MPMSADMFLVRIRAKGLGVTMNAWAEHADVAVMLWRDGKPVGSGEADTIAEALQRAEARLEEAG